MNPEMQTWLALGVVAVTVALLGWSWWRRRGRHDGCDCPGSGSGLVKRGLKRPPTLK